MTDDGSPHLAWAEDGSPRSSLFGDVYFSKDDGLAETRVVFLQGCGLPEAWGGRKQFTVAELGFGTGLNIVALLDLWRRHRPADGCLNIFSVEGFPLKAEEARRALSAWPELTDVADLLTRAWPNGAPGFHRIELPELNAVIDLAIGDAEWALGDWAGQADAWFLDGFSPALNPGMWTAEVLKLVSARSAPGARLATFTVAGAVRRGLSDSGLTVEKRPGHGRKRERLEAVMPGERAEPHPPRIAILGAGIAGASLARAFASQGVAVAVIEAAGAGAGASGFPAALVTPRLDAGDGQIAGFHAQALRHARTLYAGLPGGILADGVLQLEQAPRDAARFDKIAGQNFWPDGAMQRLDADACSRRLNEAVDTGGLLMRDAFVVQPAAVLAHWLAGARRIAARAARIEKADGLWRILDDNDVLLMEADVVILAGGWGLAELCPDLPLSPVAGQADWVESVEGAPVAWGGYAAPTATGLLFGATHDRGVTAPKPSDEASERNEAALAARLPRLAALLGEGARDRRTAVRATTPDRLPLAGAMGGEAGLYGLGGMGSRGFCVAPLLADHLAALVLERPSPLPAPMAARLAPSRFVSR